MGKSEVSKLIIPHELEQFYPLESMFVARNLSEFSQKTSFKCINCCGFYLVWPPLLIHSSPCRFPLHYHPLHLPPQILTTPPSALISQSNHPHCFLKCLRPPLKMDYTLQTLRPNHHLLNLSLPKTLSNSVMYLEILFIC